MPLFDAQPEREAGADIFGEAKTTATPVARAAGPWRPSRLMLLILLGLALIVRGRFMLSTVDGLVADPDDYFAIGWNLAHHGTLGVWASRTSAIAPTAMRPPLCPLLVAVVESLPVQMEPYSYGLLHVLFGLATIAATYRLGILWGLAPVVAIAAAALVTIDPILLHQSTQPMTETTAAMLATLTLVAITRCGRETSLRRAATAGVLFGLCVLCRPTFLVWFGGVVLVMPWTAEGEARVKRTLVLVAAAACVLAPWTLRNYARFGTPIVTTTHGGYTFLLGNNPEFYEYLRSAPVGTGWDGKGFTDQLAAEQFGVRAVAGPGELDANRDAYDVAWEFILAEPAMFAYACIVRVSRMWGVLPYQTSVGESSARRGLRYAVAIFYSLELPLAALAIWMLGKQAWRQPWLWGLLLLGSFTLVHTFYWTDLRMRAPLMGVVAILAAQGGLHAGALLAAKIRAPKALPQTA